MNILFYRYGSICEPDLIEAFKNHGFTITEETSEIFEKKITPLECVNNVSALLDSGDYKFVFSINFFPLVSDVCNIYKIPYICLIVDNPIIEVYAPALKHPTNRVFLFDRDTYTRLKPLNPDCVFHIPLASNPKRWDKVISESTNITGFESTVSFVGSLYTEKNPWADLDSLSEYTRGYVNGLMEAQIGIYGYNFISELLTPEVLEDIRNNIYSRYAFPDYTDEWIRELAGEFFIDAGITALERTRLLDMISRQFDTALYTASDTTSLPYIHAMGTAKTLTEMPLIFNRSTINLNFTARGIHSAIPLRVFDVIGCHGFLLSNYQPELSDCFTIGEDLDIYDSPESLMDKIAYYSSHPSLCRKIAENGYQKILKEHNWDIRTGQILSLAFNL